MADFDNIPQFLANIGLLSNPLANWNTAHIFSYNNIDYKDKVQIDITRANNFKFIYIITQSLPLTDATYEYMLASIQKNFQLYPYDTWIEGPVISSKFSLDFKGIKKRFNEPNPSLAAYSKKNPTDKIYRGMIFLKPVGNSKEILVGHTRGINKSEIANNKDAADALIQILLDIYTAHKIRQDRKITAKLTRILQLHYPVVLGSLIFSYLDPPLMPV